MPKGKGRAGPRKTRRLTDLSSDVEMVEVDLPRNERVKSKGKNRPGSQVKHDDDRRSRMGRTVLPAQCYPGSFRGSQATRGPSLAGRNLRGHTTSRPSPSPFVPTRGANRNRQLSTLSVISTALSTQTGPWCGKCNKLNRQLHGYLLDILKTGEQAVDEWAYAVGASPDHMECEPAPERIIPEGYRRCSQQCRSCVASRLEGGARAEAVTPPDPSSWPSTTTAAVAAPVVYSGHGEMFNEAQMGRAGLYAHTGAGPTFTRAAPGPTSSPSGSGSTQTNQTLVAIPEEQTLLHARWAGPPPTQMALPAPVQQLHPFQQQQHAWGDSARDQISADPSTPTARHWWCHPGAGTQAGPSGHIVLPPILEHNAALPITPPKEPSDDGGRPRRVEPSPVGMPAFPAMTSVDGGVDWAPQW